MYTRSNLEINELNDKIYSKISSYVLNVVSGSGNLNDGVNKITCVSCS